MKLHEQLIDLAERQDGITDGYRLYSDGSIKTATVTDSLEPGWYALASKIAGANVFHRFFPATERGRFLKVDGLREAISVRDALLSKVVESRVQRRLESSPETEPRQGNLAFF